MTPGQVFTPIRNVELLHEIVPRASTIAVLVNPKSPATQTIDAGAEATAKALGLQLDVLAASSEGEIDTAFATIVRRGAGALLVAGDAYFNSRRAQLTALAASSVDVAHGFALLFGLGTKALPSWGSEDEVEQSFGRPRRQYDGRSKRTNDLTSSIVP